MHNVLTTHTTPLDEKLARYKSTRSIALAAEICDDLASYHILNDEDFEKLVNLAAYGKVAEEKYKTEKQAGARARNAMLTPKQRSDHARKMAIARWNKVNTNKLIKDIK